MGSNLMNDRFHHPGNLFHYRRRGRGFGHRAAGSASQHRYFGPSAGRAVFRAASTESTPVSVAAGPEASTRADQRADPFAISWSNKEEGMAEDIPVYWGRRLSPWCFASPSPWPAAVDLTTQWAVPPPSGSETHRRLGIHLSKPYLLL